MWSHQQRLGTQMAVIACGIDALSAATLCCIDYVYLGAFVPGGELRTPFYFLTQNFHIFPQIPPRRRAAKGTAVRQFIKNQITEESVRTTSHQASAARAAPAQPSPPVAGSAASLGPC
ncbi:hypothetical protein EVAR_36889_1 [Eumeta japonica]|uniref:Uncharacterized protein n=1 Tax=Eumeta variegata TaxID=151549 RepID=A0A4C1WR84_EUMVA|nr:hypothetical protein EVAR_36889_1 [Eumeta japonica]